MPAMPLLSMTTSNPSSSARRRIFWAFHTRTGAVVSRSARAGTRPLVYASSIATMRSTSAALNSRAAAAAWDSSSTRPAWTTSPHWANVSAISWAAAVAADRMWAVLL